MIFSLVPKFVYDENARVCLQLLGASQHHLHWFRVEWSGRGFRPTGWTYAGVWENDWTVDVLSDTCVVGDGLIEGLTLSCYFSIWNMKPLWNGHWRRSTDKITRHYLCLQCIFQCVSFLGSSRLKEHRWFTRGTAFWSNELPTQLLKCCCTCSKYLIVRLNLLVFSSTIKIILI